MSIPAQAPIWDERRNSSQTLGVSPTALRDCLASFRALRERDPALAKWIADGYPNLTEEEHVQRFGEPYRRGRTKAAA